MTIRTDGAYNLTRRRGATGTITRLTSHTADPKTGIKTPAVVVTPVRWMFKQATQYVRLYRAAATETRVGDTTFVLWAPDVDAIFTTLSQEDYITFAGDRYEVITSGIEDNAFVVTARKFE